MNAQDIHNVVEPIDVPYLQQLEYPIFAQDTARPRATVVTSWFHRITVLSRLARFPKLTPVRLQEHNRMSGLVMDLRFLGHEVQVFWDSIS